MSTETSYNESQIEELVCQAQSGDEDAMGEIYCEFFSPISRYISVRVDEESQEDIIADVFLKCVEKIHLYHSQSGARFSSWIFRIAHNSVIDFYRKKKEVVGLDPLINYENYLHMDSTDQRTPHKEMEQKDEELYIRSILAELPADHREIIELKFLHEFSNFEISKITGKTEGNIRIIQLRALRKMRHKISIKNFSDN